MKPDLEQTLRHSATQIAPLDAERSERILANVLRERRQGTPLLNNTILWKRPWVVAMGMVTFGLIAFVRVYLPGPQVFPPLKKSALLVRTSLVAQQPVNPVAKSHSSEKATPKPQQPRIAHPLPSLLPRTRKPVVMLAQYHREPSQIIAKENRILSHKDAVPQKQLSLAKPPEDEGAMYVAVSGVNPPNTESDEGLKVAVTQNVPDSVPGHAEAAGLQTVSLPGATPTTGTPTTIPVWTHVQVRTGEEPVMTLTAL